MEKVMQSTPVDVQIGIESSERQEVANMLNLLLADEHVLYIKLRNYHWNVTGMFFKPLHELFEEQYTLLANEIDDIAERIRSLGYFTAGSMDELKKLSRLQETDHLKGNAEQMVKNLLADNEAIIQILRHDIDKLEKDINDVGTTDFLTALLEEHEKMAWMLRAHIA
ncbi:MAG: DNA starvation/stationary phase protection protein [Saprospiraceae bacterium]|nr:DNA starvation/stationary phase protection protein [Saprospiraceae bacterium]